jgi:predicted nucleic-acid-binding protein
LATLDTNILVRLITRDHPEQTAQAQAFLKSLGADGAYVPPTVLAETAWVLERSYRWSGTAILQALRITAHCGSFRLDDTALSAIELYRKEQGKGVGFADCLILQTVKDKHQGPLVTFDRHLGALLGAQGL